MRIETKTRNTDFFFTVEERILVVEFLVVNRIKWRDSGEKIRAERVNHCVLRKFKEDLGMIPKRVVKEVKERVVKEYKEPIYITGRFAGDDLITSFERWL